MAIYLFAFGTKKYYICGMRNVEQYLDRMISYRSIMDGSPKKREKITIKEALELAQYAYNQGVMEERRKKFR